jgi:hypothetical protein
MSEPRRAVMFRDEIGYLPENMIHYPRALKSVSEAIMELGGDKMQRPRYFQAHAALALALISARFEGVHETHAAACQAQRQYREHGAQYCLYLRSFFSAGMQFNFRQEAGGVKASLGLLTHDWRMRKLVAESLAGRMGTLSCINHGDSTVSKKLFGDSSTEAAIPLFSVQSHNWKNVVEQLIAGANCIVLFLYGRSLNDGVQFEIETIQKYAMQHRCIVVSEEAEPAAEAAAKGFSDVFTWRAPGEDERIAAALQSLAADNFRQTRPVEDLSTMKCYVVDREIEPAFTQAGAETLKGLEYTDFIPSSLAQNWRILWINYPSLSDTWRTVVEGIREDRLPGTEQLANTMLTAVRCLCLATTLELYDQMAGSLEIIGATHRVITKSPEIWQICYRFAAACAEWADNEPAARYLRGILAAG